MSNYGVCDFCGAETELTCIGDDNLCPECLKGYKCCDKCGGYFPTDAIPAYYLIDGTGQGAVLCLNATVAM